jgi:hypothetical protein
MSRRAAAASKVTVSDHLVPRAPGKWHLGAVEEERPRQEGPVRLTSGLVDETLREIATYVLRTREIASWPSFAARSQHPSICQSSLPAETRGDLP